MKNKKIIAADKILIAKIVSRAMKLAEGVGQDYYTEAELTNVIAMCHVYGQRLDLAQLLKFPNADFGHDVFGIHRHLDPDTCELQGFFLPRCVKRYRCAKR